MDVVTGAFGYIGKYISKALLERGRTEVHRSDRADPRENRRGRDTGETASVAVAYEEGPAGKHRSRGHARLGSEGHPKKSLLMMHKEGGSNSYPLIFSNPGY